MKYLPFIAFIILALGVFFGMHYYTWLRTTGFFFGAKNVWLYALLLSLVFPLAALLDKLAHSPITSTIYYAASVWLGIVFFAFCTLLILQIVNLAYPILGKPLFGIIFISFILILSIFSAINASTLKVKETEIENFGKDITIAHLSDIHIGTIRNKEFLQKIVDETNTLNPDVVVITGDLFDGSGKLNQEVLEPLNQLDAPIYVIMGNHEFYEGESRVIKLLNKTNATVLRNSVEEFKGIQIIGLDYSENKSYVAKELKRLNINTSKPSILLNHVPIGYNDAKNAGIKLQLSGHTHGGQMFPFSLLVRAVFPKYKGLYTLEDFSLYVSQGTGTWGPPMRLGTRSEIALIRLKE